MGPARPSGVIQDPHAPTRGYEGDYMQGIPHYTQDTNKGVVQQTGPQYRLHFQGVEWTFRQLFYWGVEVKKVSGKPVEH